MLFNLNIAFSVLFWVGIICNMAVRFQTAHSYNPIDSLWSDPGFRWHLATHPLENAPLAGLIPIVYPVWLDAVARLTTATPVAMAVYAGALSTMTPWLWYRFFRELLPTKNLARLGWLGLAWLPSWIGIYSYFMAETLLLPLLGFSLWMTWRSFRKKTFESYTWATIIWGLTVATKMTVFPIAALCVIALWKGQPQKLKRLGFLVVFITLFTFPFAYRAHEIIGVWAPFGYQAFDRIYYESNLEGMQITMGRGNPRGWTYQFWSPSFHSEPWTPLSHWRWSRKSGLCTIPIDLNKGSEDWKMALQRYTPSWRLRSREIIENVIFLTWGVSWPDCNETHFWERWQIRCRWVWAPILVFVLLSSGVGFHRTKKINFVPLLLVSGWMILSTAPMGVGEGRYRKPFEGLMMASLLECLVTRRNVAPPSHDSD